jgi:hypothetical protein
MFSKLGLGYRGISSVFPTKNEVVVEGPEKYVDRVVHTSRASQGSGQL